MEMSLNQDRQNYMTQEHDPVYFIWFAYGNYIEARKVKLMS